jgi:hypothetical protein
VTRRVVLYILLALGIILIGSGLALLLILPSGVTTGVTSSTITLPQTAPVIVMDDNRMMQFPTSIHHHLAIYEDGTIFYYEELPPEGPDVKVIKVWRSGNLSKESLASLAQFLKDKSAELKDVYQFPVIPEKEKSLAKMDQEIIISINYQGVVKNVLAQGYYLAYSSYLGPHLDIPSPLYEICERLNNIAQETKEVSRETVSK